METIRAITSMANAEAAGMDGTRSPGAVALRRKSEKIHIAVNKAIILISANQLTPNEDRATQIRLASAVDRQMAGNTNEAQSPTQVTRNIMFDVLIQEAAGRRIQLEGGKDPLDHLASFDSDRDNLKASSILNRNAVSPSSIFNGASPEDLRSIASGRFDHIENEHTRFAVANMLKLSQQQMATPTMEVPAHTPSRPAPDHRRYPTAGLGAGPRPAQSPVFGRKVSAER